MFYVKVFKTKKGTMCATLRVRLGYAEKIVSFDSYLIAEILDMTQRELLSEEKEIEI